MLIKIHYDSSTATAPTGFKTVVADVVKFLDATFTNPITLNIDVGWGEVHGSTVSPGSLGESYTPSTGIYTYAEIVAALKSAATSAEAKAAVAALPAADPTKGGSFFVPLAEAKALKLTGASTAIDGWVGFDATPNTFDFSVTSNTATTIAANRWDLFGVVAHEISEVMGREMDFGQGGDYQPFDLYDFMKGKHTYTDAGSRYFALAGAGAARSYFNTKAGGDPADWAASVKDDAFEAFSLNGVINKVSAADISVMDLLGYNPKTPPAASTPVFAQAAAAMAPGAPSWEGHQPATPLPAHAMLARPAIA
jgi:hypothetical protein